MRYISELQDVIRKLYGVESKHVQSVPVKETFQDKTVWEGIVEVFELVGHPKATRIYAWSHDTNDPKRPRRHKEAVGSFEGVRTHNLPRPKLA